ncbi:reverse transcriptase domain-containing protein [Devosia naphthalenivorans]|uniref:reverse transcriptase domain-containing protein n=1 Tax=Devosia naphthalenivorans TaxID=2082392 RepID=UPI0013B06380|nr:reverse transcriptase domain-containing protein [Devosia naphthalenivorans]
MAEIKAHRSLFRRGRKATGKLCRRIEERLEAGDSEGARQAQRTLLGSFSAKLMAYERANRKMRADKKLPTSQLVAAAERLNPFDQESEQVMLQLKLKDDGRTRRPIHSFGINHRARQYLCKMALEPFLNPILRPEQFATRKGGRDEVARRIITGIENGEIKYFVELDVEDFYPNIFTNGGIDETSISLTDWLPLPEPVVRYCLTPKHFNIHSLLHHIPPTEGVSLTIDSRAGLSQGSATSPLIAEAICSTFLSSASPDFLARVLAFNYADNFGIGGKSAKGVKQAMLALKRSAERCPRGSFWLKEKSSRKVESGFNFLGYHFQRTNSGKADISVSEKNAERFAARVKSILKQCRVSTHNRVAIADGITELQRYVESWCAGFSLAPYVQHRALRLSCEQARHVGGQSMQAVRQAFTAAFGAEFVAGVISAR